MCEGETREWGDGGFGTRSPVGWVSRRRNPPCGVWGEGGWWVSLRSTQPTLAGLIVVYESHSCCSILTRNIILSSFGSAMADLKIMHNWPATDRTVRCLGGTKVANWVQDEVCRVLIGVDRPVGQFKLQTFGQLYKACEALGFIPVGCEFIFDPDTAKGVRLNRADNPGGCLVGVMQR